jgi:hypothetical protein
MAQEMKIGHFTTTVPGKILWPTGQNKSKNLKLESIFIRGIGGSRQGRAGQVEFLLKGAGDETGETILRQTLVDTGHQPDLERKPKAEAIVGGGGDDGDQEDSETGKNPGPLGGSSVGGDVVLDVG